MTGRPNKALLLSPIKETVFDPKVGFKRTGRYRDPKTGKLVANPYKSEPWYCQKSPTRAHHWIISGQTGQCRYCQATREFPPLLSKSKKERNRIEDEA